MGGCSLKARSMFSIQTHRRQNHYHCAKSKLSPCGKFLKRYAIVIHVDSQWICEQSKDGKVFKFPQANCVSVVVHIFKQNNKDLQVCNKAKVILFYILTE